MLNIALQHSNTPSLQYSAAANPNDFRQPRSCPFMSYRLFKLSPVKSLYQEFKDLTNEIRPDRPAGGSILGNACTDIFPANHPFDIALVC